MFVETDYNKRMKLSPILAPHEQLLAQVVQELMSSIHKNEYGFPLGIYRPDLLPLEDYQPDQSAADRLYEAAAKLGKPKGPREIRAELYDDGFDPLAMVGDDDAEYGEYIESRADTGDPQNAGDSYEATKDRQVPEAERAAFGANTEPSLDERTALQPIQAEASSSIDTSRIAGFLREDLKAAFIPLNYDEGFPTLPDGRPFWEKFDFEPVQYNQAFQAFLQMPQVNGGIRTLNDLSRVMEANNLLTIDGFDHREFTLKFQIIAQVYLWHLRARAYDLYKAAAYRKNQELRAIGVQETHFNMSSRLLKRLSEYMESEEDFWDLMTPKVAMDMFKALVATQRISVGLPATAPPSSKEGEGGGNSFEMILRTLAQQGGSQEVARIGQDNRLAAKILESPEATQLAQELIIRMTQSDQGGGQ